MKTVLWNSIAAGRSLEVTSRYEVRLVQSVYGPVAVEFRRDHCLLLEPGSNPVCVLTPVGVHGEYPLYAMVGFQTSANPSDDASADM